MFNNENGYSLADIAAATNQNDTFCGNNSWWLILFFLAFGGGWGWGNGWGGPGGAWPYATTSSGITDGYILTSDFANIERKIDTVNGGLCDGFYTTAQQINGATQTLLGQLNNNAINNMQDTFALQTSLANSTNGLNAQMVNLGTQLQQSACNLRYDLATDFSALGYNLADQACQIRQKTGEAVTTITANDDNNTRSILQAISDLKTDAMREKIAALTADNQALRLSASQAEQNTYLINALSPNPIPAYMVPNPYTGGNNYGYRNCPCNG